MILGKQDRGMILFKEDLLGSHLLIFKPLNDELDVKKIS